MDDDRHAKPPRRTLLRALAAVLIGLAGALIIFVATPYSNFVVRGQYVADSYLPPAALFLMLVLVLAVNPILRAVRRSLALTKWQLALTSGILLVACVVPSSGLLRQLPYAIARVPLYVRDSEKLADAYKEMDLPPSLFPAKLEYKARVPDAENFIQELPKGESIPWKAWVPPFLSWGTFLLFSWLMMIGLGLIVLPQWRKNERLAFPLLTLHQSLIEEPGDGRLFAPLFRKKGFWIAAGIVFFLHFLTQMKVYYPQSVPKIPLEYDLGSVFSDGLLRHLPGHIRFIELYFTFVGIAFFMPNRIGFSIWFFELAYGFYEALGTAYAPPFHRATIYEHRVGAMFSLTLFVLWLGRKQWGRVFRAMGRAKTEEDRRNRNAGWMFSLGCVGMYFWMTWAGVQPGWAAFYVFVAFMVSLLITRIVAETGMPFIRIDFRYTISMVKLAPISWLGPASLYFATVIAMLFPTASRVSCATMATHAVGLDETARPRHQFRLGVLLVLLLVVGLFVSGAVHVYANYHHSTTLDGAEQPLSPWGTTRLAPASGDIRALSEGHVNRPVYNQAAHLGFGAMLCALLEWACLAMPKWPFHPVGLIMAASFYANEAWAGVFLGWLAKVLLVRFGGARLYRAARPVFLGLIMGEMFAAIYWCIDPAVRALLGLPYKMINLLPR